MRRNAKKRPAAKPPPLALGWLLTVTGINSLNALGMAQNRGAEIKKIGGSQSEGGIKQTLEIYRDGGSTNRQ